MTHAAQAAGPSTETITAMGEGRMSVNRDTVPSPAAQPSATICPAQLPAASAVPPAAKTHPVALPLLSATTAPMPAVHAAPVATTR